MPHIVVADLDLIKEITVKQFDKFTNNLVSCWNKACSHAGLQKGG